MLSCKHPCVRFPACRRFGNRRRCTLRMDLSRAEGSILRRQPPIPLWAWRYLGPICAAHGTTGSRRLYFWSWFPMSLRPRAACGTGHTRWAFRRGLLIRLCHWLHRFSWESPWYVYSVELKHTPQTKKRQGRFPSLVPRVGTTIDARGKLHVANFNVLAHLVHEMCVP